MCGAAYTPAVVTNKPNIHGVTAMGGAHPPIWVQGGYRVRGSGYPYSEYT